METSREVWWYVTDDGEQLQSTKNEVINLLQTGQISPHNQVWREGLENWIPANQCVELHTQLQNQSRTTDEPAVKPTNKTFSIWAILCLAIGIASLILSLITTIISWEVSRPNMLLTFIVIVVRLIICIAGAGFGVIALKTIRKYRGYGVAVAGLVANGIIAIYCMTALIGIMVYISKISKAENCSMQKALTKVFEFEEQHK